MHQVRDHLGGSDQESEVLPAKMFDNAYYTRDMDHQLMAWANESPHAFRLELSRNQKIASITPVFEEHPRGTSPGFLSYEFCSAVFPGDPIPHLKVSNHAASVAMRDGCNEDNTWVCGDFVMSEV